MGHINVSSLARRGMFELKKKIMLVINNDKFFMTHRLPIALELIKQDFEVHILTKLTDYLEEMRSIGINVHPLFMKRQSLNVFSNLLTFVQIIKIFYKYKPDLVHLVTIKPVLLGGVAARITFIPNIVVAITGLGTLYISNTITSKLVRFFTNHLYRFVFKHNRLKVIFQNVSDKEELTKIGKISEIKTKIIPGSGVDLKKFSHNPVPKGKPLVILAARLLIDKGIREFIEAVKILKKWEKDNLIEWWGYNEDMSKILSSSTIVVLPSYREGLPKVLIEAAACGRAIITTDVPGCRDAIIPGVSGLIVPLYDIDELANSIKKLLDDPYMCSKMGKAGRKFAERYFDLKKIVNDHIEVYNELLFKSN